MGPRRQSLKVDIDGVAVGGDNPVVVQSMTNTDTADVESTVSQIEVLVEAGSELVRVTVNNEQAAAAVPEIVERLQKRGCRVPIIGDFHYNGHLLLTRFADCARSLAKYRINPGNVGMGRHRDTNFEQMLEVAIANSKPVRIGVNWGSLDQKLLVRLMDANAARSEPKDADAVVADAMVASALESAEFAERFGLPADRIILSAKVSRLPQLVEVYRRLAAGSTHALHLGLTEAGMGLKGIVSSSAALAVLLEEGIGDTIRVSLTPKPGGDRAEEVRVARHILQALGLRHFQPEVTACPGCGRTTSTYFQELAEQIQEFVDERLRGWRTTHPGAEQLQVAVMGCIVNGPGESKHADIGISLPGTGESPKAPVYVDGAHTTTLKGPDIAGEFMAILDRYVEERFGGGP